MSSRRGSNEGTVTKRADGRWEARMTLQQGKRKCFYGRTRQEVQRKLSQARHDAESGLPIVGDRQTLSQYFSTWFASAKYRLKPSAYRRYQADFRLHIAPTLGNVPLSKLTAQQVQRLYAEKLAAGVSASSMCSVHTVLHSAMKEAVRLGIVQRNVVAMVQKPRRRFTKVVTFTEEQARAFLSAAKGERLEALYVLALSTGMRQGELLGLCWEDVDLDKGVVYISRSLQEGSDKKYVLSEPKTSHSRRRISLSQTAALALRQHRERQDEEKKRLRSYWDGTYNLVFPNTFGRTQKPAHLRARYFRSVLVKAGVPVLRFHDLRHTAATLLLRRGVNPKIVSEMLGHANVSITLDIYSHVTQDMQERAAQIMDDVFDDSDRP